VGSDDETFDNALIAGRPFILFDNRRGKFDSSHLEGFITAEGPFQRGFHTNLRCWLILPFSFFP